MLILVSTFHEKLRLSVSVLNVVLKLSTYVVEHCITYSTYTFVISLNDAFQITVWTDIIPSCSSFLEIKVIVTVSEVNLMSSTHY